MFRLTAGICAAAVAAYTGAAFGQPSTGSGPPPELPEALGSALEQLEPALTRNEQLAVLVDWNLQGECPLLDIFAAEVVTEVFAVRREVTAADGTAQLVPEVAFLAEARPGYENVLRVELTLLERQRGLVDLDLALEQVGTVVRRGRADAAVDPRDLEGCLRADQPRLDEDRTDEDRAADARPPVPDGGAGDGSGGAPDVAPEPETGDRAGDPFEFVLTADEAADAVAIIEDWLADAADQGSASRPSTALRIGNVDARVELRGSGAWRSIRDSLEIDPRARIIYAPEFARAYVLTGSFAGTGFGFYELVLRHRGRVAWISMTFPVGEDGRAFRESREVVETIACSLHFGRAALPCAR